MPRFSIIIPVYNSELYLEKCINSVLNQTFQNFEVITINDNSTDNSFNILSKYKNKIKNFNVPNRNGPSYARNLGLSKANGEYILFLDSDDYYDVNLLRIINDSINDNYDIIRFQIQYDINGEKTHLNYNDNIVCFENGIDAFSEICTYSIIDSPCCYAFNREFLISNNFKFKEGLVHEDFGLIPLIIINAKKVKCINFVGYNYVIHKNSIMTSDSYNDRLRKADDLLQHFKYIKEACKKIEGDLSTFNSFVANSLLLKATTLKGKDYKKYIKELKKMDIYDMLLDDTLYRKIKKFIIKISPKLYFKLLKK